MEREERQRIARENLAGNDREGERERATARVNGELPGKRFGETEREVIGRKRSWSSHGVLCPGHSQRYDGRMNCEGFGLFGFRTQE